MFWNQTLTFSLNSSEESLVPSSNCSNTSSPELVQIEVRTKREITLGVAAIPLPENVNQMQDIWIPLLDKRTGFELQSEVHLFLRLEPSKIADKKTNASRGYQITNWAKSIDMPKVSFQNKNHATYESRSNISLENPSKLSTYSGITHENNQNAKELQSSSFENEAAAASLNEYFRTLANIQLLIQNFQNSEDENPHDEVLNTLYPARHELENIRSQIVNENKLGEEWKERLSSLIDKLASDLALLIDTESWTHKYESLGIQNSRVEKGLQDSITGTTFCPVIHIG